MMRSMKCVIAGTLAIAGVTAATVQADAMPLQPLASTAAPSGVEHVWWRGGGWRGGYWRGGYGWRGGWGWRRPFYGYYGWRRPYWGYGYRRW